MKIIENADIVRQRGDLVDGMIGYMISDATNSDVEAAYTHQHIERCNAILDAFLTGLDAPGGSRNHEGIMDLVKKAVIALNELNDECGGRLIETDQREHLCDIIICAAHQAGLVTEEDITEQWRQW